MPEPGESYSAAGVNYERLQEEVLAGEANVKEMTPMPSSASSAVAASATSAATAAADSSNSSANRLQSPRTQGGRSDLHRDDIMYFSIE